eukprot:TRINITY_DN3144_c0_g2_i1.p2 TRINITY_DN3144_c0_g2~~TRINITY_DN3144_c0_g2_i1.p2  ORF type:complete len:110 (-),score=9.38 TRINITY_DN3144_c0_g2_i1:304-633(-)
MVPPARHYQGRLRTFYHSGYFRSAAKYPDYGQPLDSSTRELLDVYDSIANSTGVPLEMELRKGDMQLVSNHIVVHSRTGYIDYQDPAKKRHLLRLWLSIPGGGAHTRGM